MGGGAFRPTPSLIRVMILNVWALKLLLLFYQLNKQTKYLNVQTMNMRFPIKDICMNTFSKESDNEIKFKNVQKSLSR